MPPPAQLVYHCFLAKWRAPASIRRKLLSPAFHYGPRARTPTSLSASSCMWSSHSGLPGLSVALVHPPFSWMMPPHPSGVRIWKDNLKFHILDILPSKLLPLPVSEHHTPPFEGLGRPATCHFVCVIIWSTSNVLTPGCKLQQKGQCVFFSQLYSTELRVLDT